MKSETRQSDGRRLVGVSGRTSFALLVSLFLLVSCGYHIVGSRPLPFQSVTIEPVRNKTYEPRLEERMHLALSNEFINQGIDVKTGDGRGAPVEGSAVIETTVTKFALGAIGAVDEFVKEQEILMLVNVKASINGQVTEFKSMESPIQVTFQSTGSVSDSVARKERATDKACREIAREIVSKLIILHAK